MAKADEPRPVGDLAAGSLAAVPDRRGSDRLELERGLCPYCAGRGFVIEQDGGAGRAVRCECRLVVATRALLDRALVPERYRAARLANFSTKVASGAGREQLVGALAHCRRYVDGFLDGDGRFAEGGMLFVGPPGAGKTHLAVAVLTELMTTYRVRGRFVDFTHLIHDIQATFDRENPESKRDLLDPVTDAEVLVLDELGAQKPTPWVADLLYLVINTRYAARRPTLFTTNFALDPLGPPALDSGRTLERAGSLDQRIPATLISRLYEMARPIVLDAVPDYRREIRMHQHRV